MVTGVHMKRYEYLMFLVLSFFIGLQGVEAQVEPQRDKVNKVLSENYNQGSFPSSHSNNYITRLGIINLREKTVYNLKISFKPQGGFIRTPLYRSDCPKDLKSLETCRFTIMYDVPHGTRFKGVIMAEYQDELFRIIKEESLFEGFVQYNW